MSDNSDQPPAQPGKERGLASLCHGIGGATAFAVECLKKDPVQVP